MAYLENTVKKSLAVKILKMNKKEGGAELKSGNTDTGKIKESENWE